MTTLSALNAFHEENYDVVCPKCAAKATGKTIVNGTKGTYRRPLIKFAISQITCMHCGFNRQLTPMQSRQPDAWTFWYVCGFKGQRIWAINYHHLQFMITVLAGEITESNMSLYQLALYEAWPDTLKLKKNRQELLRLFRQLATR
ncbi:hypothetical protein JYG55_06515 [Escherichia fergusonii]|uniref:hypothetical protein n=1 Tax=Escherichia fergusonii TaxID=564 RepID=UPI001CC0C4F3|nr:hypothetical protein [Escherichia fergusonii]EHJ4094387.1 hypothetical protein [Escherichia fergusonii]EHJ4135521.1 hypothetical protein [Escherichia fergusonii]MBZ4136046.1 hypothetical protein [Escherichia fergusonii]MBZ4172292.1 hypothetical protein [Escherichia fergusonii]UAW38698.1 hypothetical protein JW961_19460 [Escherichia fergusonii]